MADKTKIEWADATWTPLKARRKDTGKTGVHCVKVSPECANCYSEALNKRNLPQHGTGLPFTVLSTEKVEMYLNEEMLLQPLRWKRPRTIFVNSQTDTFGEFADVDLIARMFAVMALAHHHRFLVLTKRADRMFRLLDSEDFWGEVCAFMWGMIEDLTDAQCRRSDDLRATAPEVGPDAPLPNVWLGVTAGTQKSANERIPWLLKTPAAEWFLSAEPLLEELNLRDIKWHGDHFNSVDALRGGINHPLHGIVKHSAGRLGWVIAGGESGRNARPMHPDWARSLRDQCVGAGVSFFFKQWGEWADLPPFEYYEYGSTVRNNSDFIRELRRYARDNGAKELRCPDLLLEGALSKCINYNSRALGRVGKKAAGRLLDGREWNEVPGVTYA